MAELWRFNLKKYFVVNDLASLFVDTHGAEFGPLVVGSRHPNLRTPNDWRRPSSTVNLGLPSHMFGLVEFDWQFRPDRNPVPLRAAELRPIRINGKRKFAYANKHHEIKKDTAKRIGFHNFMNWVSRNQIRGRLVTCGGIGFQVAALKMTC